MEAGESQSVETGADAEAGPEATSEPRVDVGVLVAHAPGSDVAALRSFADQMATDVAAELEASTGVSWRFHAEEPDPLSDAAGRRPSEFIDRATHRMVEGPYDVTIVITDVRLVSSRERIVPGLASPLGRIAVVSTRALRGRGGRSLSSEPVRWNAVALVLHLIGHLFGARHRHADGGVMEPFAFDASRREAPAFDADVQRRLERVATRDPQAETTARGPFGRIAFHAVSAVRNAPEVLTAVVESRAPLLPLSLPKLSTAALTPTLVIVFSAEAWDVGFHMSNATAGVFAAVSVVAAALYLLFVQNLSFPRKRHRVVTEHTALVNVTVFCILLLAMVGLFALVCGTLLVIELLVFPPNLMSNWPSLEDPAVSAADLVRTAAFISTIGVLSGALAGGLESRTVVRHLALFRDRP